MDFMTGRQSVIQGMRSLSFFLKMAGGRWNHGAIAFLLLWSMPFFATADEPRIPGYFLRSWKTDSGLPDNAVAAVTQTHEGYLWVGTYGGLARFDGVAYTPFNSVNEPGLQSDRITALFEDTSGTLWIGHESGDLSCYRDGQFQAQSVRESGTRRKIFAIGQDDASDIWMLSEDGTLVRVRDGAILTLPNQDGWVLMAQSPRGHLWVASGGKVAAVEHGKLVLLNTDNAHGLVGEYIQGICADGEGGLWIASNDRVRRWRNGEWVKDLGENPAHGNVTAMLVMKNGGLAMGTVNDGLFLVFTNGATLHLNHTNGLPHDWIRCLAEDREGTLWMGAGSGGLAALRAGNVDTMAPPDRFEDSVALSTTTTQDGTLWAGSEGAGLYRLSDHKWQRFDQSSGLSNLFVWCVSADAKGRVWAGTWGGGIFWLQGDRFVTPPGLENVTVPMAAILHGSDGVTWIGTGSGLIRYQDGAVKWFGEKEGLKTPDVRAIAEGPDGTIWFGTLGDGVGYVRNGELKLFHKTDGLSSDYVQCLHFDAAGELWLGTYGSGLDRFKNGSFAKITTAQGLPNNFICGIEEDERGNFWISSHGGIFRVAKRTLDACADGQIGVVPCLTYGLGEGMPSLVCSGGLQPAAAKTSDGRLWFPTSKGLAVIDPADVRPNRLPPPVIIESAEANGHALAWDHRGASPLRIQPGWQRLEFRYAGLSFVAPEEMRFQWWLEGLEKNWEDAGTKRVAEYNYLPPANYTFHVRACNSDGVWNEDGAALSFTVLPHFWQRFWFRAATSLAIALLLAGAVFWSVRRRMHRRLEVAHRQQAVERERTRIAKDIHDHLGANLTRISLLSQYAQGDLGNPTEVAAHLDRIYGTARELTRAMDEIVWAVNPQHDTLDSLASYLGNFAQDYLAPLHIRCRLEVPLQLPHWPITAETRHNVFLAFKEALHNVVKHSGAEEVSIFLTPDADRFTLIVRDNGKGFDPSAVKQRPGRGNGLKNMAQRLEKIGGRCDVHSQPGTRTDITFHVAVSQINGT